MLQHNLRIIWASFWDSPNIFLYINTRKEQKWNQTLTTTWHLKMSLFNYYRDLIAFCYFQNWIFSILSHSTAKKPKIFAIYSAILYSCVHIPPFSLAFCFCKYSVFAMTDYFFFTVMKELSTWSDRFWSFWFDMFFLLAFSPGKYWKAKPMSACTFSL